MFLLVVDERGVVLCFHLSKGIFVASYVFFERFTMDSEPGSSVSSLEPTSCGLHPVELRGEPGGGTREGHVMCGERCYIVQPEREGTIVVFHHAINCFVVEGGEVGRYGVR